MMLQYKSIEKKYLSKFGIMNAKFYNQTPGYIFDAVYEMHALHILHKTEFLKDQLKDIFGYQRCLMKAKKKLGFRDTLGLAFNSSVILVIQLTTLEILKDYQVEAELRLKQDLKNVRRQSKQINKLHERVILNET